MRTSKKTNRDLEIKRQNAQKRAENLKATIQDYLEARKNIPAGLDMTEKFNENKKRILQILGAADKDWNDWKWQLENRITSVHILAKLVSLTDEEIEGISQVEEKYRWAISPYYASLMDPNNPECPIRKQSIPSSLELYSPGKTDPMAEEFTSPAPAITRRYPDRLIINVTNQCAMYCRHCQSGAETS